MKFIFGTTSERPIIKDSILQAKRYITNINPLAWREHKRDLFIYDNLDNFKLIFSTYTYKEAYDKIMELNNENIHEYYVIKGTGVKHDVPYDRLIMDTQLSPEYEFEELIQNLKYSEQYGSGCLGLHFHIAFPCNYYIQTHLKGKIIDMQPYEIFKEINSWAFRDTESVKDKVLLSIIQNSNITDVEKITQIKEVLK